MLFIKPYHEYNRCRGAISSLSYHTGVIIFYYCIHLHIIITIQSNSIFEEPRRIFECQQNKVQFTIAEYTSWYLSIVIVARHNYSSRGCHPCCSTSKPRSFAVRSEDGVSLAKFLCLDLYSVTCHSPSKHKKDWCLET